jgi:type I restriction enzyme S subunit
MARVLYREWFVEFRFPGCESVSRVDSSLGPIPEGWELTRLKEVTTKIGSGATPRGGKDAYKTDGISLIRSLNIYDYEFEFADLAFIDEEQAGQLDNVILEPRDVLLNITGASVARCAMVPPYLLPARVNQHVAIIRADPKRADPFYLLDTINNDYNKQKLLGLAQGGATREALTKETISDFQIMLPPRVLLGRYGQIAGAIHSQREILQHRNQNLRRTRDLLLPRLLSGQVSLEISEDTGVQTASPPSTVETDFASEGPSLRVAKEALSWGVESTSSGYPRFVESTDAPSVPIHSRTYRAPKRSPSRHGK